MATAALVVTVGATLMSQQQQRKAAKAQRRQNRVANRIAGNERMRSIKQAIAARRVREADIQSAGFSLGVSGGSAVQGASASNASGLAGSIGASNQQFTGQTVLSSISNQISQFQQNASTFGGIANLAAPFADEKNVAAVSSLFSGG